MNDTTAETPTPALRWKKQLNPPPNGWTEWTLPERPVLQQLWEIRENGATRQEWRAVLEVQADAEDRG